MIMNNDNLNENNYYNVILRDEINSDEDKYLGKLIKTLRVKNNSLIDLPNAERKVFKPSSEFLFDYYKVFDKWLDDEGNAHGKNFLVQSNITLNASYNELKVPKVANVQIINDTQSMMNTFIIRSTFPIYLNDEYQIEDTVITIAQLCAYESTMDEYQTTVEFALKELDDFEGNTLELNGQFLLFDQNNYDYINDDLSVDIKLNFYRSDASTGD
ncbi:MAG: hypothetical protein IJB21_03540 [Bacilli bacterium]|nr:hypothetical protein [Bacilli bacterium]